jgi:S-DNA-T family DNA segregation ATPase FtsK/SpoIIIE
LSAQRASGSNSRKKPSATGRPGSNKASGNKSGGKKTGGKVSASKAAHSKQPVKKDAKPDRPSLLDSSLKRELIGVLIAVLAIALFIAVVAPGTAILSLAVSETFRLLIGGGSYILPFLMLIWAASFFIEKGDDTVAMRFGIGLALIFVSVLAIAATMTPGAAADPGLVFERASLMAHGGYVGGGIAWGLLELVGQGIALVILVGLIIASVVLIGFSITGLIARIRDMLAKRREPIDEGPVSSPYDLQGNPLDVDGKQGGRGARQTRDKLIAATAQLSDGLVPTRALNGDFSEGDQGRIPFDDLGDLGSTRRSLATGDMAGAFDGDGADGPDGLGPDGAAGADAFGDDTTFMFGADAGAGAAGGAGAAAGAAGAATARGRAARKGASSSSSPSSDSVLEAPFELPSIKLLKVSRSKSATKAGEAELRSTADELQATIEEFGVDARVEGWVAGPTVTLFKLSLGEGVRLSKINSLADDIALALAAPAVRIFSPIPGTTLVGIEVPNVNRSMVLLGDVLPDALPGPLQLAIGKDVEGGSIVANLEKMPHLLIGGTTGSGKSVAINAMIMSILMRATPSQVRMILIDPKMVELSLYNDIPHLYVPVVTDAQKAAASLAWGVLEMERRLKVFQQAGVKNIAQYNDYVRKERQKAEQEAERAAAAAAAEADAEDGEGAAREGADGGAGAAGAGSAGRSAALAAATTALASQAPQADFGEDGLTEMPLIVIVIDELADLMMVAGKEVETSISRLAQLARAAGLHLIIATQRPSTNVITGLIKANIVNRIAFNVASGIDSRVILDGPGAENLIGVGDLLFSRPEYGKPQRIQGCFVSEPEIEAVVNFLKAQGEPEYHEDILATAVGGLSISSLNAGDEGDADPLVWEAAEIVVSSNLGSTSTLQRRLKVGYARAGRIMDMLEQKGIVGPPNGSKPREVLVDDVLDLESLKALEATDATDW